MQHQNNEQKIGLDDLTSSQDKDFQTGQAIENALIFITFIVAIAALLFILNEQVIHML